MQLRGNSPSMQAVRDFITRAAPSRSNVLIEGESGTGKELVARCLHDGSPRARGPFVAINCAAIPEHLLESELFGYERGAFTGAIALKKGRFELASGGTLFLDEIGEINLQVQVKLLRALQERIIDRVGGTHPVPVDIRVIAATNRDLKTEVDGGRFRFDLRCRLKVLSVRMPALRNRRSDIPELVQYFLQKYADEAGHSLRYVSPMAISLLCSYDWPGNVRELQNAIEGATVLGSGDTLRQEHLPEELFGTFTTAPEPERQIFNDALSAAKRVMVEAALGRADGDCRAAATMLHLHPKSMYRMVRNFDLAHLVK